MVGLSLQLRDLWIEDLNWRTALFMDVVGNDWEELNKELRKIITIDAVILGLSLPKLLANWLEGTYINLVLDQYKVDLVRGIDWLLTGDPSYLSHIDEESLKKANKEVLEAYRSYLEEMMN
jgi:hypothetical protein